MSRVRNLVDYQSQISDIDGDGTRDLTINGTITATSIDSPTVPKVDLAIAPEVLEIQVAAPAAGQNTAWLWTWETSSLPYARREITNSAELQVPLYKQGTYVVNNFAAYDLFDSMTQTHSLYLKWIDGAGTDNLVSWATSAGPISDSHPDINGGTATDVQRITVNVPATITLPTLTAPSVSYSVTNNSAGAYTFSGSASGDNPNIGPFYRGGTYTFNVNAVGHPFYLTTDNGTNFSAGTYFGEYTSGVTGSRSDNGTVTIVVPNDAPDTLYYQCGNHSAMRGAITVKDLAVETNINGNYIVYFQHTQEGHKTPVELRPIPSLVNQMCIVYDASVGKFVPQDLATYVENTPSFENKIREVAGTAELVVEDGSAVIAKVNVYDDSTYLPLTGNNPGDQAFATDTDILYIWDGSAWQQAGAANTDDLAEGTTNLFYTDARVGTYLSAQGYDTATNIVASITDSAPATLDTLNELAAALGDDPNFATTTANNIATKLPLAGGTMSGTLNIESGGQLRLKGVSYTHPADNVGVLNYDTASGNFDIDARSNGGGTNIRLSTSNAGSASTKMFIQYDGNVGIGTTSPVAGLDVANGAGYFTSFNNPAGSGRSGLEVGWDGSKSVLQSYDRVNNTFEQILYNASSHYFATGSIGIGTDSPQGKLDVKSTSTLGSVIRKDFGGTVGTATSKLALVVWGEDHDSLSNTDQSNIGPMIGFGARLDNADPNSGDVRAGIAYSYNGDLTFHAKAAVSVADGSSERLRIDGLTGNVGIGGNAATGSQRLYVQGGAVQAQNTLIGEKTSMNYGVQTSPASDKTMAVLGSNSASVGVALQRDFSDTYPDLAVVDGGKVYLHNDATLRGNATYYDTEPGYVGWGRKIESHVWKNWAGQGAYTARLYTPIVHNESNMFTIEIDVYGYGSGGSNQRYVGSGYAYGGSSLITYGTNAILGSLNHRLTTATHPNLGVTVVCFDLGYSSNNGTAYYNHMRWRYQGWGVKKEQDFVWSAVTT